MSALQKRDQGDPKGLSLKREILNMIFVLGKKQFE